MPGAEGPWGQVERPAGDLLRDRLAAERTGLANERTLLAYLRTALAFLVGGLSLLQFFASPIMQAIGWLLSAAAGGLGVAGWLRFRRVNRALHRERGRDRARR